MNSWKHEYSALVVIFMYIAPVVCGGVAARNKVSFVSMCVALLLQVVVTTIYLYLCSKIWILDESNAASLLIKVPVAVVLIAWLWDADLYIPTIILFGIINAIIINTAALIFVGIMDLAYYVSDK